MCPCHAACSVSKCCMSGCGKWYHQTCLTSSPLWPQVRVGAALACPHNPCHTCASGNIRDPVMKYTEKLIHCVRCSTAHHCGDYYVAAGTIQITKTDIICPKHYNQQRTRKVPRMSTCTPAGVLSALCCED